MDSNSLQFSFLIQINDGFSFRNTIGMMKNEVDRVTMILPPSGDIEMSFINRDGYAIHIINLKTEEFGRYIYNFEDETGDLLPSYPISFETSEMFSTTKGIGRRDGIRIYLLKGDTKLNVQAIKHSTKDPGRYGASFVKVLNIEPVKYTASTEYSEQPNVRIQSKEFAEICAQASAAKCAALEIIGHQNGVTLKGKKQDGSDASIERFTSQVNVRSVVDHNSYHHNCSDQILGDPHNCSKSPVKLNIVDEEESMRTRVPIQTVKSLAKIHNISPSGTMLRFHFKEKKPAKLKSPIGTYGKYTIYLKDRPPVQTSARR